MTEHRSGAAGAGGLGGEVITVSLPAGPSPAPIFDVAAPGSPADVIFVAAGCRLPDGWREALHAAAHSSDIAGTASPLTTDQVGWPAGAEPMVIPRPPAHPRIQLGGPGCFYVRREALDLIDTQALPGDPVALMHRISREVLAHGMVNVLADDLVIVAPDVAPVPGDDADALGRLDRCDEAGTIRSAARVAAVTRRSLTVAIDGRALSAAVSGTQRSTLELVGALSRFTDVVARVVLPPDPSPDALAALAGLERVETIDHAAAAAAGPIADVVHRPHQVFSPEDLVFLRSLGERLVITHQDLIAFHNPDYHRDLATWEAHRRITRLSLAVADRVVFYSQAARADAVSERVIDPADGEVIGIALQTPFPVSPMRPDRIEADEPFIVCLGADFRHKNRPFAIRLAAALRERHGWSGRLVLAGAHVEHGSSAEEERSLLAADPRLAAAVVDLARVSEAERAWLLQQAQAVIVPSVIEGFGLLVLEAAAAESPCVFAARSSLAEVGSAQLATIAPWDPVATAQAVAPLLSDGAARAAHLSALRSQAWRWQWPTLAAELAAVYAQALGSPTRAAAPRAWQELQRESRLAAIAGRLDDLETHLGGRESLARDDGLFTEAQLRGLWRVGSRPRLARAAMWPFGWLGDRAPRGR